MAMAWSLRLLWITVTTLLSLLHHGNSQLSATDCGKTMGCIRSPPSCTSHKDCTYLITYIPDLTANTVEFKVSAKLSGIQYLAVGFNNGGSMGGTQGDVCILPGNTMKGFVNSGYSPSFETTKATLLGNSALDGALICRYRRGLGANGYQRDLKSTWNVIIAYGTNVLNGEPKRHGGSDRHDLGQMDISAFRAVTTSSPTMTNGTMATSNSSTTGNTVTTTASTTMSTTTSAGKKDGNHGNQQKSIVILTVLIICLGILARWTWI